MKEQEWEQLRARGLGLTVEQVRRIDREREDRHELVRKLVEEGTCRLMLAQGSVILVGPDGKRLGTVYID